VRTASDEFDKAFSDLSEAMDEAMKPLLDKENGRRLAEVAQNQLTGIKKFYDLLLSEQEETAMIDGDKFDLVVDKYRAVAKHFVMFPGLPESSTYKMSVVSDLYYILRRHTHEWGRADD
jgi:hypothetical protein